MFLHIHDYTGMLIVTAILGYLRTLLHTPLALVFGEFLPQERWTLNFIWILLIKSWKWNLFLDSLLATACSCSSKGISHFWLGRLSVETLNTLIYPLNVWVYHCVPIFRLDSRCHTRLYYLLPFAHIHPSLVCSTVDYRNHLAANLSKRMWPWECHSQVNATQMIRIFYAWCAYLVKALSVSVTKFEQIFKSLEDLTDDKTKIKLHYKLLLHAHVHSMELFHFCNLFSEYFHAYHHEKSNKRVHNDLWTSEFNRVNALSQEL